MCAKAADGPAADGPGAGAGSAATAVGATTAASMGAAADAPCLPRCPHPAVALKSLFLMVSAAASLLSAGVDDVDADADAGAGEGAGAGTRAPHTPTSRNLPVISSIVMRSRI